MRSISIGLILLAGLSGCAHRSIALGNKFENGQLVITDSQVVTIKEGKRDYGVLVAPDRNKGGTSARAAIRNSMTYTILHDGFMYIWGDSPVGGTRNVNAATTGTTMVFELLTDRERVYLLAVDDPDETVTVHLAQGSQPAPRSPDSRVLHVREYVECVYTENNTFDLRPAQPIPLQGPIMVFLNSVKVAVDAAGADGWPSPWPW